MIKVKNGEITYSDDKETIVSETLFLLENLKTIANLNEEEINNLSKIVGEVIKGNSKKVLTQFRKNNIKNLFEELGIKTIKGTE